MRLLRALLCPNRTFAGIALLAALVVGEMADTRHHLSEHGCATDARRASREEQCTCAGLHAAPLAGHAPVALALVELEHGHAPAIAHAAPARRGEADASPRAPPRS
jgi:hypothetical protein